MKALYYGSNRGGHAGNRRAESRLRQIWSRKAQYLACSWRRRSAQFSLFCIFGPKNALFYSLPGLYSFTAIIHTKSDWKGSISHNFTKVACLGCYKKDYPDKLLTCFNEELVTLIGWDPPGYGTSRPPDRKQSINRCEMDARVAIKLMKVNPTYALF